MVLVWLRNTAAARHPPTACSRCQSSPYSPAHVPLSESTPGKGTFLHGGSDGPATAPGSRGWESDGDETESHLRGTSA